MKSYLNANMHDGTGKSYQLDGYEAGGKTGSAWVVDPKTHAYKNGIIIGSFMGFAPLKNPKFVVLITVDEPKDIGFGALSAGPIWHDVMSEILRYSNAPKEKGAVKESTKVNLPDTDMMTFDSAKALIEDKIPNVKVENAGNGEVVVDQIVTSKNNEIVVSLQTKQIKSGNFYYIPDLSGKTKKEVESIFSKYKFQITFHGTGKVVEQNVSPGQITSKEKLTFWLE
jgi:membrane peptidoglycan carboxypeptidase